MFSMLDWFFGVCLFSGVVLFYLMLFLFAPVHHTRILNNSPAYLWTIHAMSPKTKTR